MKRVNPDLIGTEFPITIIDEFYGYLMEGIDPEVMADFEKARWRKRQERLSSPPRRVRLTDWSHLLMREAA